MADLTIAQALASALEARDRCAETGNTEWYDRHSDTIRTLLATFPTGSGFDSGPPSVNLMVDGGLVFGVVFHAMNDAGVYAGWIPFQVTARPSWHGLDVDVHPILDSGEYHTFLENGVDVEGLADYVGEVFYDWLTSKAPAREAA